MIPEQTQRDLAELAALELREHNHHDGHQSSNRTILALMRMAALEELPAEKVDAWRDRLDLAIRHATSRQEMQNRIAEFAALELRRHNDDKWHESPAQLVENLLMIAGGKRLTHEKRSVWRTRLYPAVDLVLSAAWIADSNKGPHTPPPSPRTELALPDKSRQRARLTHPTRDDQRLDADLAGHVDRIRERLKAKREEQIKTDGCKTDGFLANVMMGMGLAFMAEQARTFLRADDAGPRVHVTTYTCPCCLSLAGQEVEPTATLLEDLQAYRRLDADTLSDVADTMEHDRGRFSIVFKPSEFDGDLEEFEIADPDARIELGRFLVANGNRYVYHRAWLASCPLCRCDVQLDFGYWKKAGT